MQDASDITLLLRAMGHGDRDAFDRLVPAVYDALRALARRALRNERAGHTLSATALAHEAYLKLVKLDRIDWRDRAHFFGAAAGAMRRILVDHAMARRALKRGGVGRRIDLDFTVLASDDARLDDLIAINEALEQLAAVDHRAVRVVECRVFMGMTTEETAEALGVSPSTVKRLWNTGRAWLTREMASLEAS
jgi:RNA polymerase sigma factor (TIGR02999 family)